MTTALSTPIDTGTWTLDPMHSSVGFRVQHLGISWLRGRFDQFEMSLHSGDDGSITVSGSTPVDSVAFTNEKLHGHLMSPDFFDAELHPSIAFTSSSVDLRSDGSATVMGELTMRGATGSITLQGTWSGPVVGLGGERRIGLELAGKLDRFAYGIGWNAQRPGGGDVLGATVRLEGDMELVLQ